MGWIPVVVALACSGGTDSSKSDEAETVPSDLPSEDTSAPSASNEDTGEQDTSVPWVEGLNEGNELWPPSLYEEQRLRRLGG